MELVETLTAVDGEAERAQLVSELAEARTALAEFEEAAAIALQRQVEAAVQGIRLELTAECEETRQLLADTEEAAAIALERQVAAALDRARSEWEAERESLKTELGETSQSGAERERERESLRAECLNLRTELNEASQSLAEIQESYRRELSEHKDDAAQRERLVEELHERTLNEQTAESESLRAERLKLKAELDEKSQFLAEIQENYQRELSEQKDTAAQREQLAEELHERTRNEQAAEHESLRAERLKLKAELDEKSQFLAEIQVAYRRELSEHKKDDAKRERLVQELREAKALLAEKPAPSATIEVVRMESARVDALMQELSRRIDDPEIELSEVMRKTVERSQLEAYLKGLWFSANQPV